MGTIILAMLLALILGIFLAKMISKPIKKLTETAEKLALGDVDVSVEANSSDEIGLLTIAFSKMVENIKGQVNITEKIAAGDLSVTVDVKSDKDLLGKKLVEMQGGLLKVESKLNKGSKFHFYLRYKMGDQNVITDSTTLFQDISKV